VDPFLTQLKPDPIQIHIRIRIKTFLYWYKRNTDLCTRIFLLALQNFLICSICLLPTEKHSPQKSLETFPVMMVLCRSLFHVPIIREDIFLAGGGISRIYLLPAFFLPAPPSSPSPSPYPSPLLPHRKKIATGNAIRENSRQAGSKRDITEKKEMKKKQKRRQNKKKNELRKEISMTKRRRKIRLI
jgi:hypothetical protein